MFKIVHSNYQNDWRKPMPKRKTGRTTADRSTQAPAYPAETENYAYCGVPAVAERVFAADVDPLRAALISLFGKKWVNGTVLHYYFFDQLTDGRNVLLSDGTSEWRSWTTTQAEEDVVRQAFARWQDLGIGLKFEEVDSRDEAEIRIGFMRGDGAWSYIGRDIIDLNIGRDERTMNFGWDLTRQTREIDTAIHEIGHTLGFPHEHQNPNAGIVWDEEAVYTALAQPPNRWDRNKTFHNIIRKIDPDSVQGSTWDPDSIMHYPFGPGLIKEPAQYRTGLSPAGGLSERDKTWVRTFYPPIGGAAYVELKPFESNKLALAAGEQRNFIIRPAATRYYEMRTFGTADTVVVLFEDDNGTQRYLTGDDDSGEGRNAYIRTKLIAGRTYILRIRLYYANRTGETAVMLW
jgi:hypothetical protein